MPAPTPKTIAGQVKAVRGPGKSRSTPTSRKPHGTLNGRTRRGQTFRAGRAITFPYFD